MALLPKEHGAYGELMVPLVTALLVAGVSAAALLLVLAIAAGFLGHEPAAVLLGSRGPRARREQSREAAVWLTICAVIGVIAGVVGLSRMPPQTRLWVVVPVAPALVLAALTGRRREKTWYGELAAASAFALTVIPVAMASGASFQTALSIAIPFLALFASTTLAVRAIIARVRGGGDVRVAAAARRSALTVAAAFATGIAALTLAGLISLATLIASAPGLLAAVLFSLRPPRPTRLKTVGWTLVATSVATALIVIAGV